MYWRTCILDRHRTTTMPGWQISGSVLLGRFTSRKCRNTPMNNHGAFLITSVSGIGAETARQLASRGSGLYLLGRDQSKCQKLAAELQQAGADVAFTIGDLTEPTTAPTAVRSCVQRFGRLHGLFNVAGISGRRYGDGPVHECSEEGWAATLHTNATTQYR